MTSRRSWATGRIALTLAMLATLVVSIAGPVEVAEAQSPAIVVTSTGDQADADPNDGQCRSTANTCTLRAAITEANARPGPDRIEFSIGGSGVRTITANSSLPTIDDASGALTIDGYTQPGARANTAAAGSNAAIRIQIAGPSNSHLFRLTSAANEIRGLAMYRANIVVQIDGEEADGNRIVGNFVGTNAAGTYENPVGVTGGNTGVGVLIELGPDRNVIGAPGLADRNVISGNGGYAIRINHGETSEHRVQNNVVGLNPSLTAKLRQVHGIDLQWWTWGNLIGGDDPSEANLVGGHIGRAGIELSHAAQSNLVIGNLVGTMADGNSVSSFSGNTYGIALKDDPTNNYIANNVVGGNGHGVYHKHNYTRENFFVDNRFGVGVNGGAIPNTIGTNLNGLDQVWHGNLFGYQNQQVPVVNYLANQAQFYVPAVTKRNRVRQGQYHNPGTRTTPYIDITPTGFNPNDPGDGDTGIHDLLNSPVITGVGPGKVFGTACGGCEVEVYVSGSLRADGSIDTSGTAAGTGLAWIATVTAAGNGTFSLADGRIVAGRTISALAIDGPGNTSELPVGQVVPASHSGQNGTAGPAGTPPPAPAPLPMPPPYEGPDQSFVCSVNGGTLTWTDAGAPAYYVFATINGVERYLGGHQTTSLSVEAADSYRVEHWLTGRARNAICDGAGVASFECSVDGATLSWTDVGADEYYVFATTNGTERYLGGHRTTSLSVGAADSYRVEHWPGGQAVNATCDGAGAVTFGCSVSGAVLTWTDVGAPEYYVFASTDGIERYLGAHSSTSLSVDGADFYRIEHWLTGSVTNALCSSDPVNLAAGRPATQSSTAYSGDPARAVDGNTDGTYNNRSVTHTATTSQPWWQVDLGSAQLVDEIEIWNRTDCCASRLSDFRVFVSEQPFGSRTLAQLEADPAVWSTSIASLSGPSETVTVGSVGRYVRIQLAGTNPLSLAEVRVIG